MAIASLRCPAPIRRLLPRATSDYDVLHEAIALFDEGRHLESLRRTLEHMFPDHELPDLREQPFVFGQGSSRVTLRLHGDEVRISVPMARLTEQSITPAALRFALSRISAPGQLHQPRLHGDELRLELCDALTRMHPHKLREVLRKMPFEADANDDWMEIEFHCAPVDREPIEPLTAEELARALEIWHTHWHQVDELVKESQRRRSMFLLNELTALAVHHIEHVLPLTGYLWSRLTSAAASFNDSELDPNAREAALAKCVKEMKAVEPQGLAQSLGHARYAISPRSEGNPKVLRQNLGPGDYVDTIIGLLNGGRYLEAALGLISTYSFLLARFRWPATVERLLLEGLAIADGRPWREATVALLDHGDALFEEDGEDDDDEPDAEDADDQPGAEDEGDADDDQGEVVA